MKEPKIKRFNLTRLKIKETGNVCKKVYFATQKDADEYISKLQKTSKREKVPVNSYLCERCKAWHLTSWSTPDVKKVIEDINSDINTIIDEYNESLEHNETQLKKDFEHLQKFEIEYLNLNLENQKLKIKLKKYENNKIN